MTVTLLRSYSADLELRGGDGRTLVGLAAPFNAPADIFEHGQRFTETIAPGAFSRTIAQRGGKVPLHAVHDVTRKLPLGPVHKMTETGDGLRIEARISKTQAGDEVLELIRDGALSGLSIGFSPVREQWSKDGKNRTLQEIALREISVVDAPAYREAQIAALRSALPAPSGPTIHFYERSLWLARQEH